MRKITTAILLIIATTGNVLARYTDNPSASNYASYCTDKSQECFDGCYFENANSCAACPAGTYDTEKPTSYIEDNPEKCSSCDDTKYIPLLSELEIFTYNGTTPSDIPEKGLWYYDPDWVGAERESECAVVIKCPAGKGMLLTGDDHTYLSCETCKHITDTGAGESDRETDDNYFSSTVTTLRINDWVEYSGTAVILNYDGCIECPANSTVSKDHDFCMCNAGYRRKDADLDQDYYTDFNNQDKIDESTYNTNKDGCVPHTYPVTVYNDCEDKSKIACADKEATYGSTLSKALSSCSPTKTGYHRNNDNEYKLLLTGSESKTININDEIIDKDPSTKFDICPIWTANMFNIKYLAGQYPNDVSAAFANNSPITENTITTCTYGIDCNIPSDTPIAANSAYVFIGWKITGITGGELVEGYDMQTTYSKGAVFKNATEDNGAIITLTAQWQECPAGYYGCAADKLEGEPCPAGSTSNPGATDITGCFITSATQFCDKDGKSCFKLNICTQTDDGTWKGCPGRNNTQTTN